VLAPFGTYMGFVILEAIGALVLVQLIVALALVPKLSPQHR
jgi:hypothetical protein